MNDPISIYTISLPEYTAEEKPDYTAVGRKLDRVIESYFPDRKLVIRGISLVDHPGWSLEALIANILELGTDRYEAEREGVHYPDWATGDDIWACPFMVVAGKLECPHYQGERCPSGSTLGEVVGDFWDGTLSERGFHERLNLLIIYDYDYLEIPVEIPGLPPDLGSAEGSPGGLPDVCLFRFKHPDRKPEALIGIVKIL